MKKLLLLCLICWYSVTIVEASKSYSNKLPKCKITTSTINDYEPEEFQLSNNLLRKTGQQAKYCATKIIVSGTVLDQNCVPVPDAKVYLWQVGCDGKYPYVPLRTRIDKKRINPTTKSTFTGSGTATTDNNGNFYFITVYPGRIPHEVANLNVRVEHRELGQLQTKLYLSNKAKSYKNCGEISPALHKILDETRIYEFKIVIPGKTLKKLQY